MMSASTLSHLRGLIVEAKIRTGLLSERKHRLIDLIAHAVDVLGSAPFDPHSLAFWNV